MPFLSPYLTPIVLLIGSNIFMTAAWYWHLRYKDVPIVYVTFISWGLAFVEYCLAVPANRYGSAVYNPAQLKTMQEVISFVCVCRILLFVLAATDHSQPGLRLRIDCRGCILRLQNVVTVPAKIISPGRCAGCVRMRYR